MAQYSVPQFIESEGKIIFFLTFRQFFILVGGGAACFILYLLLPFSLFVIFALFITVFVIIVTFVKINDESVVKVFLHFIGYVIKSKTYTWKKNESLYPLQFKKNMGVNMEMKNIKEIPVSRSQNSKLKSLQKMIDTRKS